MKTGQKFFIPALVIEGKFLSTFPIGNAFVSAYRSISLSTDTTISLDCKNWQTSPVLAFAYSRVFRIQMGG
jgi:hypothetical protein